MKIERPIGLFSDLKSLSEELENYLALYNVSLPDWRLKYYCQVLEEKKRKKEPVIDFLSKLPFQIRGDFLPETSLVELNKQFKASAKGITRNYLRENIITLCKKKGITSDEALKLIQEKEKKKIEKKTREAEIELQIKNKQKRIKQAFSMLETNESDLMVKMVNIDDFSASFFKSAQEAGDFLDLSRTAVNNANKNKFILCKKYVVRIFK